MAIDKKKLKNLDLWGKDDTTVTTTTGKTYKMSQVGTKNYTVNQKKAAENKAAMAKAEQVHKQAQAKAQQQQKAQQKAQIKTTAADRVKKSLLSMPEMTDYTRESVQPDKYDTTPGTLPKIKNVLRRADNAGASILAKQLGSKEAAIKTAAIGVKSKATSLLGGNESDRYKRQMSALSSKYGVRATTMPEYKLAQLNYNNALAKEKIKSRQAILKATKSADDYKKFRNAALDGLTGGKRTAANFLMGAGDMGADIALLGATGAVGGAAAMGLGAMGDKARQVALKGGTTDDALKAGLLSGGVSAAVNYAVPKALGKVGALAPKALPTYRNSILAGEDLIRSGNSGYISGLKGLNSELAKTVLSNAAKEGVHGSAFGVANTLGQGAANALLGEQTGITPGSLAREAGTGFIMGAGMGGIRGGIGAYGASRGNKAYAEGFADEYNKHYDELRGDLRKGLLDRQVQQTPLMLGTTKGTLGEKIVNDAKNTPLALPKGADFTVDSEGNITKFQNPTEPIKAYNDDKITKYEGLPGPTANEPYPVYDGKQSLVGGKTLGGKINKAWAEKNTTPGELPTETVGNKETLPKESNGVFTDNPAQKELLAQKNTVKADYSKVTPNIKTRVENINGTRREYISNTNEARKDFIKYARENFPESVTVKSNGMKVDISRKGLDKLLSGKILKEKYASSFYVPELVENAYGSTYSKYNKPYGKTKENIEGYTYMKSNINIDGTSYTAHIRIRTSNDSNHYYGHTLSGTIDDIKIEPLDADGHNKIATSWPVTSANDSNQSISNNSLDVNVKSTTPGELTTYGKGTVGAAEANPNSINSQLEELSAKYGSIPYGEEPRARVDNIPKSIDGKTRVSQFARTMIENPATPDSFVKELEQDVLDGKFSRAIVTDPDALAKAQNSLNSSTGYKKLYDEKFTKELYDLKASNIKDKFAMGKLIYEEAIKTGDEETATRVTGDLTTLANLSGQGLQAVRLMKKMTPDGNLYALEKTVKGLNEKRAEKRFFKPKEEIKINPELAEKLLKSKSKEEMVKNVEDIQKDISSQMDSSLLEAIDEWRHFAMLANPTTHLKNTSGNAATAMLYRAKDVIGTGLEKTVNEISKATGHGEIEKTKSIMMPIKSKEDKALVDFAKSDYETNMKDIATSAGSGKVNMKSAIEKHKNVFNSNPIGKALNKIPVLGKGTKAVGNVLDKATKGNSALLDAEDNFFIKQNYTNALSKYMKANKYTPEYLKSAEGSEALSKAQDYALKQALEATFHDDNIIATGLNKLINSNSFVKFLGDAFIPYKKTPLNIARRAVEYSPVGLAKGTRDFAKSTRNWGSSETTNAIDELAKGLTGSGLMALGFLASHKGYLTSGLTDDKKLNGLEKAEGKQNFALNLKDYTVSLESFSPAAIPLLAGAGLYETMSKGDKLEPGAVVDTLGALLSPMVEMSVLSSIDSLITDVSYAKQGGEDILTAGIGSAAKSYAGQLMPTSLSKLSNTLDDTKRSSSYIDKNKSTGKIIQGIENQYKYKNPLTHKQLPPALDVWGREQKTKSAAVRVVNNFLNPTTVKKKNITAVDKEVERLYKSTGDSEVIPSLPNKYMNYKNTQGNQVRKDFTANEYTKYVKERNNATLKDIDGLIKTQEYKNLSDEDKAKVISGLFDYNNDKAKGDLAKDYEIQKSTAKIDDIVASTGMSKANAILYRQTLSNMDKGGKDADEINDYLFNNNSLTAQQKNKLSQEYVKDYVFVNRQKDIDFSNKESYEVSQMSESARKHYNEAKKMGYNAQSYQKAYDIVSKQKENYTKDSKIADLQKQCGMSHTQAIEFWDMLKKKKK
mgnify:CR=1 FL=1|jgi:hypothetical protein